MGKGYPLGGFKKGDSYKRTKQLNLLYAGGPVAVTNKKKRKTQAPPKPFHPAGK